MKFIVFWLGKLRHRLEPQGFLDWWKFCIFWAIAMPVILDALEGRFVAAWVLIVLFVYIKVTKFYRRRKTFDAG